MKPPDDHPALVSLREEGFLSVAIERMVPALREREAAWFDFAVRLNRAGQRVHMQTDALIHGRSSHDTISLSSRLLIRALSGFQGAFILAERGMTIEAAHLTRSNYETGFWLGYLGKSPVEAVASLVLDEERSQLGHYKALVERIEANGQHDYPDLSLLRTRIAELSAKLKGKRAPDIGQLARLAGLEDHYLFYKQLSANAAHPSLHSLHHHLEMNDDNTWSGNIIGPDGDGMGRAISLASHALLTCLAAYCVTIGYSEDDEAILGLHHEYQRLVGASATDKIGVKG